MPTVLAHVYSDEGFVIAADGLDLLRDVNIFTVSSERAQKVFPLEGNGRLVACAFYGTVTLYDDDRDKLVFDFVSELHRASRLIASDVFPDATTFGAALANQISDRLQSVVESGCLNKYLAARAVFRTRGQRGMDLVSIYLDGYFRSDPYRSHIYFFTEDGKIMWQLGSGHPLSGNGLSFHGSQKVADHLFDAQDDDFPHLAKYRSGPCRSASRRSQPLSSLQDAIDLAGKYVASCCDADSKAIDPICDRFGGKPHLATITLQDGFQWVDPPGEFRDLLLNLTI